MAAELRRLDHAGARDSADEDRHDQPRRSEERLGADLGLRSIHGAAKHQAISLPLAWSKSGLPIGVQFVGRFGEEHLLLAAQIEKAKSWNKKRPAWR
jgi:Asp-tRNA(Asn)/Glu-tRNA(Gln) amidotransferase A subunit family amidase